MPLNYEKLVQYATPFRCPECGEHTFQTDKRPESSVAFDEAECTNCGHVLTIEEIQTQAPTLPSGAIEAMLAKYRDGN